MLQSKRTLCNQQISVPNSNRKVTMKTCLESLLDKTSPKSIFLIPPFLYLVFFFLFLHFCIFLTLGLFLVFFFFIFKLPLAAEYQKISFKIQAWPLWGTGLCPLITRHSQECFPVISSIIPDSGIVPDPTGWNSWEEIPQAKFSVSHRQLKGDVCSWEHWECLW